MVVSSVKESGAKMIVSIVIPHPPPPFLEEETNVRHQLQIKIKKWAFSLYNTFLVLFHFPDVPT